MQPMEGWKPPPIIRLRRPCPGLAAVVLFATLIVRAGSSAAALRGVSVPSARKWFLAALAAALFAGLAWLPVSARQDDPKPHNPLAGNPRAIRDGQSTFRVNCSYCHGLDASGGFRAPSLATGRFVHGDSDDAIFNNILHGIPGTQMPASDLSEAETWELIAYLRSLAPPAAPPASGNAAEGKKYFFGEGFCDKCHMVRGQGGRFGPDLTRIGALRPRESLIESLREPGKVIAERSLPVDFGMTAVLYEVVKVTTAGGQELSGVPLNEDNFSLQLMGFDGKLHLWLKKDLKKIVHEGASSMPVYGPKELPEARLQDLLAYLQSLRGE
jgi:putative heme-binding domain-containing protein